MVEIARRFTMADVDQARQFILDRSIQTRGQETVSAEALDTVRYLNPVFAVRAANLMNAAEEATGGRAIVTESWRSDATQAVYYANRHGTFNWNGKTVRPDTYVDERGKTVTRRTSYPTGRPGGGSVHRDGWAIDFSEYGDAAKVRSWMRKNAAAGGLAPIRGDDPHLQFNPNVPLNDDEAAYTVRELGYKSVEDFQKANGLKVDGVIGQDTTRSMMKALSAPSTQAAADPNAKPYTVYSSDIFAAERKNATQVASARAPIDLSPADRDIAIRTIIGEAEGEGGAGQEAVAQVIANRFDQGYGPSVAAIAGDETQFNAWAGDRVTAYGPGDPVYEQVGQIVDRVFAERPEPAPEVGNSTEFYSGGKEPGYWGKGAVQKIGQVGNHVFGAIKNAVTRPKSFMLRQSKGDADLRVSAVQTQLKQAGLYDGEVDGKYGPQTTRAVKAWQQRNGMRATGVADASTLRSLRLPASEAGFQRMFMVNPETPANRAKLFPDDQPRPANADAVEELVAYDPLEQLRGKEQGAIEAAGDRRPTPAAQRMNPRRNEQGDWIPPVMPKERPLMPPPAPRLRPPTPPTPRARPDINDPGLTFNAPEYAGGGPTTGPGRVLPEGLDPNLWGNLPAQPQEARTKDDAYTPLREARTKDDAYMPAPTEEESSYSAIAEQLARETDAQIAAARKQITRPEPEPLPDVQRTEAPTARSDLTMEQRGIGPYPPRPEYAGALPDIFSNAYGDRSREYDTPPTYTRTHMFDATPAAAPDTTTPPIGNISERNLTRTRRAPTPAGVTEASPGYGPYGNNRPPPAPGSERRFGEVSEETRRQIMGLPRGMTEAEYPTSAADAVHNTLFDGETIFTDMGLASPPVVKGTSRGVEGRPLSVDAMRDRRMDQAEDSLVSIPAPPKASSRVNVNGRDYTYDGHDAIRNDLLGLGKGNANSALLNYAGEDGVAEVFPEAEELVRPDPTNILALAAGQKDSAAPPKSAGAVTPPRAATSERPGTSGPSPAAATPTPNARGAGGLPSSTNPNFTGTSVETNPITGKAYAVGTWSNGARAIQGPGWTAVENKDGTYSYAGNPLSNMSFGGSAG